MRLDSLASMTSARALHSQLDFRDIRRYRDILIDGEVFLELQFDRTPYDS
jgi:hypothetical protein